MQTTPLPSFPPVPSPSAAGSTPESTEFSSVLDATAGATSVVSAGTNGASSADSAPGRPSASTEPTSSDPLEASETAGDEAFEDASEQPGSAADADVDSTAWSDGDLTPDATSGEGIAVALAASGAAPGAASSDGPPRSAQGGSDASSVPAGPWATSMAGGAEAATRPAPSTEAGASGLPSSSMSGAQPAADVDPVAAIASGTVVRTGPNAPGGIAGPATSSPVGESSSTLAAASISRTAGGVVVPSDFVAITPVATITAGSDAARANRPGNRTSTSPIAGGIGGAAASRAAAINEAVAEGRSAESPMPHGPPRVQAGAAVAPWLPSGTSSAPVSTVMGAQGVPMMGAGVALESPDGASPRTLPGVARGLDALSQQRGGSLVMRLDPPSLGQVKLEMTMQAGRVAVLMTTAADTARSLLNNNLGMLRQALEDRGLAVERLTVESVPRPTESGSGSRSEHRGDGHDARSGQDADGRQDAGQGRSRGRREDASGRPAGRDTDSTRSEAATFGEALADAGASEH